MTAAVLILTTIVAVILAAVVEVVTFLVTVSHL